MAKIIGLPKLSPTMEEGTLAKWVVEEGASVGIDDLLAEVETDKATMEFRSFDKGVLLKILAQEGDTLAPDEPVAIIGKAGDDISALLEEVAKLKAGKGGAPAAAAAPAPTAPAASPAAPAPAAAPAAQPVRSSLSGRVLASPLVRRLAREQSLDLQSIVGTGPNGRVIKRDLEGARPAPAAARGGSVGQGFGSPGEPRIEKLSQMRKVIARRLTESKQTVPHFYLTIDVDAEPVWNARKEINESLKKSGKKTSLNDFIIKAVAVALRRMPEVNASFMGDSIHYHPSVDISVAVAVPDGLMTPVVRGADRKGILEIGEEVRELAGRARERKLMPEEMMNGTFSVSNLGMFGIEEFSAVINPPEGAILAVGTVREEPVVKNGAIAVGKRMRMTMSCDHRVIDGAVGAAWLKILKGMLENPTSMLL